MSTARLLILLAGLVALLVLVGLGVSRRHGVGGWHLGRQATAGLALGILGLLVLILGAWAWHLEEVIRAVRSPRGGIDAAIPLGVVAMTVVIGVTLGLLNVETARRLTGERAARESEDRWNAALVGSELGVWDWNAATDEVYFSDQWCAMLGYRRAEIPPRLDEWSSRVHPDDLEPTMALIRDHLEGRTPVYVSQHRMRAKDGSWRWILDRGKVLTRDADGRPLRVVGTHTDITGQKQAEAELRQLEERLTGILRFSPSVITLIDREGRYLLANPEAERVLGRPASEIVGRTFHELMPAPVAAAFAARLTELGDRGEAFDVEDALPTPVGPRTYNTTLFPLFDDEGRHYATGGIAWDVTELRGAMDSLRRTLAEREVLLREIHHRVKNNLQIVSSLLNLQARRLTDPAQRAPFDDARQRVVSMALIHDQLYRQHDLARIDFRPYLNELVRLQRSAYGVGGSRIRLDVDVQAPPLPLHTAIPCGLIASELVSNALKHAFPDGREGRVVVRLRAEAAEWELAVEDTGMGAAAVEGAGGLGLEIVDALARQLGGTVAIDADVTGHRARVRFPSPAADAAHA